jgi:hypothetical protein
MRWIEDIFGLMFLPFAVLLILLLAIVYGCKRGVELLFKE